MCVVFDRVDELQFLSSGAFVNQDPHSVVSWVTVQAGLWTNLGYLGMSKMLVLLPT